MFLMGWEMARALEVQAWAEKVLANRMMCTFQNFLIGPCKPHWLRHRFPSNQPHAGRTNRIQRHNLAVGTIFLKEAMVLVVKVRVASEMALA